MGRTGRLRNEIAQYLEDITNHCPANYGTAGDNGESNTSQILDHINKRFRWGATMNQVGNLLARDSRFEKLGITEGTTMAGFRERVCIWALAAN